MIEARQYDGSLRCSMELLKWIGGRHACQRPDQRYDQVFEIVTLEGAMTVSKGDWVIRGVQGEFYPCKPSIFEQTYEPASA